MSRKSISFSKDLRDKDGDVYMECILLHLSDNEILKVQDTSEIKSIANQLIKIAKEIDENY